MAPLPQACSGHVGACQSPEKNWTWTPHSDYSCDPEIPFWQSVLIGNCHKATRQWATKQPRSKPVKAQEKKTETPSGRIDQSVSPLGPKSLPSLAFPLIGPTCAWFTTTFQTSKSYLIGNTLSTHFQTWLTSNGGLEADLAPVRNIQGLQLDPLEDLKYRIFVSSKMLIYNLALLNPLPWRPWQRKLSSCRVKKNNAFLPPLTTLSSWPGPGPQVEFCGIPCTWCFAEINQSINQSINQRTICHMSKDHRL